MPTPFPPVASTPRTPQVVPGGVLDDGVFYSSADGMPMGDNQAQIETMCDCLFVLRNRFPHAYVVINLLLYPRRGNPDQRLAPDVMLAFGVPAPERQRESYRVWDEGKPPDWVLEIASDGPVGWEKGFRTGEYAAMGVREYWLYDAQGTVFDAGEPRLQGYGLAGCQYQPLPKRREQGADVITSRVLGLELMVEDELIRFRETVAGMKLLRQREVTDARIAAEARLREDVVARQAAEARVAELEALLRELEGEEGGSE